MGRIVEINRRSIFSFAEAQELLPVIFRITKQYSERVQSLIEQLEALGGQREELVGQLEDRVNEVITEWQNKVTKLGVQPKGLWIADFDAGDGYFCWKFPEQAIAFWHSYSDGFSKRCSVEERDGIKTPKSNRKKVLGPISIN